MDNLTPRQYKLLLEALRRWLYSVHVENDHFEERRGLRNAWTGLGTRTLYKPVLDAGLMEFNSRYAPRTIGWLRLTDKGVEIVKGWLDAGYNTRETLDALQSHLGFYSAHYQMMPFNTGRTFDVSPHIPPLRKEK